MKTDKFIKDLEAKGYRKKLIDGSTFLSAGCECMCINKDGSISIGSPAGNFQYKSLNDYIEGNASSKEEYIILD